MADTKTRILANAISIIQRNGYTALTMRQLASECDMKLASLQYHFKTWEALVEAIADYILEQYATLWNNTNEEFETVHLATFIEFILDNIKLVESARLWPQLRAWGLVEPRMKDMLGKIYSPYLDFLIAKFSQLGCPSPRSEALIVMITLEGASVFVGNGSPYYEELDAVKKLLLDNLEARFGASVRG